MRVLLAAAVGLFSTPLFAGDIMIDDAYARASRPGAPTGAMFMTIMNHGAEDDTLVAAASPVAKLVELHTHIEEDGVMKMRPVEEGFEIPAGGMHMLQRGGDHVMLMGVTETLENGDMLPLVLTFEKAGEVTLEVMVDNDRDQGKHGMGQMNHKHSN